MDDDDLFCVFTQGKKSGYGGVDVKHKDATERLQSSVEYNGFSIDATPANLDWRTVTSSANVDEWVAPVFLPMFSVPLPLARNKCAKHDESHLCEEIIVDSAERDAAAAEVEKKKRPIGNLCFNCGERGHNVSACPKPRDNDAMNLRRKVSAIPNL